MGLVSTKINSLTQKAGCLLIIKINDNRLIYLS